ncbi:transcription factor IIF subunit tfg1 [Pleosporales sp. CAS-2024a]
MNGHTPAGSAPAAPGAANGQQLAQRARPPAKKTGGALRAPRKPLKSIARPVVSLIKMNESKVAVEAPMPADNRQEMDAMRQEYLNQGAHVFPLIVTRRDLKELRHHVMRLQHKGPVDIQDKEQFTPPIRLHRRDPRAPPSGAGSHFEEEETKEDLEEIKERERIELQKDERRKVREENQAKIAPTGKTKTQAFKKNIEQKYRADDTPEAKKRQLLRYEETLPWHLEDFENKQTWVGTYESELSETHIMLSMDPNNPHKAVYMAPMERWYRFNVKSKLKPTGDDVDKIAFKIENDRGFLGRLEAQAARKARDEALSKMGNRMATRLGGGADDEGRIRRPIDFEGGSMIKREADADDIDFNLDEDFADDEEGLNGLFEGEAEDVKEAEEKLKRDRLAASLWDRPDEAQLALEEELAKKFAEDERQSKKIISKQLAKKEKRHDYLDSDDENPYITSSESDTDTETERARAKEEEEKKALEANGKAPDGGNIASGESSKGTNTPSGNHRSVDIRTKKRPGSPNLSEASGNESSRKKHKKNRERLPDGSRKSALAGQRGAASGSDSEMTDAGRIKKSKKNRSKLGVGAAPSGSPGASRAASPAASPPMSGSRAASPDAASPKPSMPTAKELYESLPPAGMNIQALIAKFKGRVDRTHSALFIRLVKAVSSFDKAKAWLTPLPQMPSEESINAFMNAAKPKPAS